MSQLAQGQSAISLSEGHLTDDYPVVRVRSRFGATIDFTLLYNSSTADGSRFATDLGLGLGWTHSFFALLFSQSAQPEAIFRLDPSGRTTRYGPNGDGTFSPNTGYFETLIVNPDGTRTVREKDGTTWTFELVGGTPLPPPFHNADVYRLVATADRRGNTTTLTYVDGLLTTISDVFGRTVQLAYGPERRVQRITDPAGRVTSLAYDPSGRLHTIVDPELRGRSYFYNAAHQLVEKLDRDGRRFSYLYQAGKPVAIHDSNGRSLFSLANPTNWATNSNAMANHLSRQYIPSTTTRHDGNARAWQHSYDINGYLTQTAAPDGSATAYQYDAATLQVAAVTDANAHTTSYLYDALGNRVSMTDALGHETVYSYDPVFNKLTSTIDPNGRVTTYVYDAVGNRIREVDALGGVRRWTYDAHGNVLSMTDQRGNRTRYEYDGLGQRVKMIDPLGRITTYTYDIVGNLLSETDPNLHVTSYAYDALDRRIGETDALGNAEETVYDGEGHVIRMTDRNLHVTQFEYDSRGRRILAVDAALQASAMEYDGNDNLISATDPGGHATHYTYDSRNRLTAMTDALNQTSRRAYDAIGNLLREIDANGHVTVYTYDELNRRRTLMDAEGAVTEWRYDAVGSCLGCTGPTLGSMLATQQIDAVGKVTYLKYDGLDRLVREIRKEGDVADSEDASDAVVQYSFDAASNQIAITDPVGQTTVIAYDKLNRRTVEQNPLGEVTRYVYDKAGNLQSVTEPNRNRTTYSYDAADRVIRVADAAGLVQATTYDPKGNVIAVRNGVGATTQFAYDVLDRLTARTDPLGQVTAYGHDPDGNVVDVIDREDRRVGYSYDAVHRRTQMRELGAPGKPPLIRDTRYQYDAVGNLTQVTDPNARSTSFTYDSLNRRLSETYPDDPPNVRTFTYDGVGNIKTRTDQVGRTTTYVYNDLHFLVRRDYPSDPDDLFTYDPAGRVLTANRGSWPVTFAYDAADRLVETVQNGQRVRRGYDISARTRQLVYPGGRVLTELLDARDRKTGVLDGAMTLASFVHDDADRVRTRKYANGVVTTFTYDSNDQLTRLLDRTATATLLRFQYGYDREGNKLFEQHRHAPANSESYDYDGVHRLVDRKVGMLVGTSIPTPITQTAYDLDLLGNWNEKTTDGVAEVRAHNAVNEITAVDTTVVLHDDLGNLTNDGTRAYTYDEENRLVRVIRAVDGAVLGEYQYDALGRRVGKLEPQTGVATHYFYDGQRIIEEQNVAGATRATYVHGNDLDEVIAMDRGGQRFYYHHNALWSVSALSGAGGGLVEGYRYDAYGRQTVYTPGADGVVTFGGDDQIFTGGVSAVGNPYTFTGRELDGESGLMHYRARAYHPDFGRFLQRDPLGYADAMNLYGYAHENPINRFDPSGLNDDDPDSQEYEDPDDCCTVDAIVVRAWEGQPGIGALNVVISWQITITGNNLQDCEFTQYITNSTWAWDAAGNQVDKEKILKWWKHVDGRTKANHPFSTNEKDDGWGKGDQWRQFTSGVKEVITDNHNLPMPTYKDDKMVKVYAAIRKSEALIKVRNKKTFEIVKELKWSYEFWNHGSDAPKAPSDGTNVGIYNLVGIEGTFPSHKGTKKNPATTAKQP